MKIFWLEKAAVDLQEAYEFIALDNLSAAAEEVDKILKTIERLGENPAIGKAGRIPKTRELVIGGTPYIVIFRVKDNRLEILRIFHGARQWPDKSKR